jgi:alpha-amylase
MAVNRPESIDRLRSLSDRGQVEILGGGLYEPILVSLPQRDRRAQLTRMRAEVERLFGKAPTGAWLAERVWEPSLPFDLASAGYGYTVLDDNHLRGAAVRDEHMWGTYTTDDQGRMLTIFGTEKGLRYRIPWQPVGDLIEYLKDAAEAGGEGGHRLGIMGDDGEKFGGWPGTHDLCWGEGTWIDDCFTAIAENKQWLTTVTPSEWMAREAPLGRIYIPTSSYVEMTEWALPPNDALTFTRLVDEATNEESEAVPFLRGGMWRNFQARYREINDLHKQMLRVSAAVNAMPPGPYRDGAVDHLHRGQSNDCYWHGLFGGVYIVHMRMATAAHLIAAEDLALGDAGAASGIADYDLDGVDEVLLGTAGQTVLVDVAEGAGISAWDLRASRVALASVLRRRPEAYHEKLREIEAAATAGKKRKAQTISPHEAFGAKEAGLSAALVYDDHERRSGLVRLSDEAGREIGEFVNGPWGIEEAANTRLTATRNADGLVARKTIDLNGSRTDAVLSIGVSVTAEDQFRGTLEVEMNINLSGGGGNPDAYYRVADVETRHDGAGNAPVGAEVAFGNRYEGVEIRAVWRPPAAAEWSPVETVSNSEAGFEKTYQGSCLLIQWPVELFPGEEKTFGVEFQVAQTRDRAAEERAEVQSRAGASQRVQANVGS